MIGSHLRPLTLLHSEPPKLYGVLAVLSAKGLKHLKKGRLSLFL